MNIPMAHDGLYEINDNKEQQDTGEIEFESLVWLKGILTIQLPLLEEQGWPVEFFMTLKQRTAVVITQEVENK